MYFGKHEVSREGMLLLLVAALAGVPKQQARPGPLLESFRSTPALSGHPFWCRFAGAMSSMYKESLFRHYFEAICQARISILGLRLQKIELKRRACWQRFRKAMVLYYPQLNMMGASEHVTMLHYFMLPTMTAFVCICVFQPCLCIVSIMF